MPDGFSGAEQSVDAQKQSALNALAQFGRRGLEAAVQARQETQSNNQGLVHRNNATGNDVGARSTAQRAELAALTAPGREAYANNARQVVDFLASEQGAQRQVAGNYFDQVRQAVPLERTNAAAVADQYRAAAAERQAALQAQAARDQEIMAQAALQQQLVREQMARDAEYQRLVLEGYSAEEAAIIVESRPRLTPATPQRPGFLPGSRRVPIS